MLIPLTIQINGQPRQIEVDPDRSLLSVLRDDLGLTGTKYGCGDGKCGACTLLLDGSPIRACSISVGAAAGSHVTTVEGLAQGGRLHAVQSAFLAAGALQCGYCTPGMIMSSVALLDAHPQPSAAEILHFMQDNICRCGSYTRILAAIQAAAQAPAGQPAAGLGDDHPPVPWTGGSAPDEGIFVVYPDPDLDARLAEAAAAQGREAPPAEQRPLAEIGPWLHLAADGSMTVYVGKAEVGQGIRTSLAQIVAEELRVPVAAVQVVMGDTGRVPYDVGTFGSRTTPITGAQLWRVGAAARAVLLELAAAIWGADPSGLTLEAGAVRDREGDRSLSFAELARDRQITRIVPPDQPVTPASAWSVAGHSAPKINGRAFVTGQYRFAADASLPGMLHGKVLRPPAFHAVLEQIDTSAAEAMEGVTVVQDGDFVGVTAPDVLTATQALDRIRARWRPTLQVSQPELFDYLKANPAESTGRQGPYLSEAGSVEQALAGAYRTLRGRYTVDYIAHVPLEPRTALAQWEGDSLTVWTGTQRPFGVRSELAQVFGLDEQQVRVIVPDTGAGYGGKHAGDAAVEAVRLAKAAGRPVKIVWTRQEEFTWAYFRPAGLIELTSGVDAAGRLVALEHLNYNSGAAGIETLYTVPNRHIEYHPAESPLRQGAYRALSSTANHFARETHIDELAHLLGLDPLELRLRNLADPRMVAVLTAAARGFGWGECAPEPHHGVGLAGGFEKGSYVAACVEVYVNPANRQPKVLRVVEAFDCGAVLN
ncbi:MAG: hypothetical protein DCC57_21740, partial [Chloroflexi bacterium]